MLSKNFTLNEFIVSETAKKLNIDNTPTQLVIDRLQLLVDNLLQPLRDKLDKPIHINSGYRCIELNRAIRSKDSSQHILGEAADITVFGMSNIELFNIVKELEFDQLILEHVDPAKANSGWVHVSYTNRYPLRYCVLTITQ